MSKQQKENQKTKSVQGTNQLIEVKNYLHSNYGLRKNEVTKEIEIKDPDDSKKRWFPMDDEFLNDLWLDLQVNSPGLRCSDKVLKKILYSKWTPKYNPIKNFFESLDPVTGDPIQELADTIKVSHVEINLRGIQGNAFRDKDIFETIETRYDCKIKTNEDSDPVIYLADIWPYYLRRWLVSCVSAGLVESAFNPVCIVLAGGQGKGKSSWLNQLCPPALSEYLYEGHLVTSISDYNTSNYLAEKWFINIDDQLDTLLGKDFNSIKAIITAQNITNRKKWSISHRKRPRLACFMGSVNNSQILRDDENRRYLMIQIKGVNWEKRDPMNINPVWSQAYQIFKEEGNRFFQEIDFLILNRSNANFMTVTPEQEILDKLYRPATEDEIEGRNERGNLTKILTFTEIFQIMSEKAGYNLKLNYHAAQQAIKRLGFDRTRKSYRRDSQSDSIKAYAVWPKKIEASETVFST